MSSFFSPYRHQLIRIGACVPHVAVTEPRLNADNVLGLLAEGDQARVTLMVFPELCLSAYAIDDLLFQDAVLDEVARQVDRLICTSAKLFPIFVVGAPLRSQGHLYNCGVVIHRGALLGVVPRSIAIAGHEAPFGSDLLFAARGEAGFTFHVEICEDLWVPRPPSTAA